MTGSIAAVILSPITVPVLYSSLVFTVVPQADLETTLGALRRVREESPFADETRLWAFSVEELA